jgi:beta-glucosidase
MFSHPIFSKNGGWPPEIKRLIDLKSKEYGFDFSMLPSFTPEEIKLVKGNVIVKILTQISLAGVVG